MQKHKRYHKGLGPGVALGASGGYRDGAVVETLRLATCHWDGFNFTSGEPAAKTKPLFNFYLPSEYSTRVTNRSWTGLSLSYEWDSGGVDAELRRTLPGVLIRPRGKNLRLRWLQGLNPTAIRSLQDEAKGNKAGFAHVGNRTCFAMPGRTGPVMLVFSTPPKALYYINHNHCQIEFSRLGASLMIVPLLDQTDLPRDKKTLDIYREILVKPPIECKESYRVEQNKVNLHQDFGKAAYAPLPQIFSLLDKEGGLLKIPARRKTLLKTLIGPYDIVKGSSFEASIRTDWMRAEMQATRKVKGRLAKIPEELAYAGDATWEPGTPMDQFLALRTWAPLIEYAPERIRKELIPQLQLPTPAAFRKSLVTITEPTSACKWQKDAAIFPYWGDVCYDADWYNGLTLSGLDRATRCADAGIASDAKKFSRDVRRTRELLIQYYELFHDWAFCSAWSCPNGTFWNQDCAQNGLEGLLGEARLRGLDDDSDGADRMVYLAAKTAVACMASYPLGEWCFKNGFLSRNAKSPEFGVNGYQDRNGASLISPDTKNPYFITNHFPEYFAMLRDYGRMKTFKKIIRIWERDFPERYRHWLWFYIKRNHRRLLREQDKQEERVQGAVFYHLAPELCLRQWTLQQDPDEIESLYHPALNLAELLLIRAGVVVD